MDHPRFHELAASVLLTVFATTQVTAAEYRRDVTIWQEVTVPPSSEYLARGLWSYAANYARFEWRVFAKSGQVHAQLTSEAPEEQRERPGFTPQVSGFRGAKAFAAVDDGWLVGFNQGEFGAALYWFSRDGLRNYEISDHHIVEFVSLPEGVCAIEGLAHLSLARGSMICMRRPSGGGRWQARTRMKFSSAPYAISIRRDGTMLITLSDALVSIDPNRKLRTLLADAPWSDLYANSSVLSDDEQKLYIGMRQFVGEYDLETNRLRLLIPSDEFLNKLSAEDEKNIRRQYDVLTR